MPRPSASFRKWRLRPRVQAGAEEIIPGDFVKLWNGSPTGVVESVNGGTAVVASLGRYRERAIVPASLLTRTSADPAFGPDVRNWMVEC